MGPWVRLFLPSAFCPPPFVSGPHPCPLPEYRARGKVPPKLSRTLFITLRLAPPAPLRYNAGHP
jgi:hypothetical protein